MKYLASIFFMVVTVSGSNDSFYPAFKAGGKIARESLLLEISGRKVEITDFSATGRTITHLMCLDVKESGPLVRNVYPGD